MAKWVPTKTISAAHYFSTCYAEVFLIPSRHVVEHGPCSHHQWIAHVSRGVSFFSPFFVVCKISTSFKSWSSCWHGGCSQYMPHTHRPCTFTFFVESMFLLCNSSCSCIAVSFQIHFKGSANQTIAESQQMTHQYWGFASRMYATWKLLHVKLPYSYVFTNCLCWSLLQG